MNSVESIFSLKESHDFKKSSFVTYLDTKNLLIVNGSGMLFVFILSLNLIFK